METRAPTRGARRKAHTAAAILNAAEQLFRDRGFQATTIEEIAELADVSVGSVYVHFRSKQGLYLALVERALDLNEEAMAQDTMPADASALDRVLAAGDAYLRFHLEQPGAFQMIALRVLEPSTERVDAEVEDRIAERVRRLVGAVETDLRAAAHNGEIRADLDAARLTRFLWGSWNGVIAMTLRQDGLRIDNDELIETLALGRQIVVDALRSPPN
jgi:AcrR family transcriptional regulator